LVNTFKKIFSTEKHMTGVISKFWSIIARMGREKYIVTKLIAGYCYVVGIHELKYYEA